MSAKKTQKPYYRSRTAKNCEFWVQRGSEMFSLAACDPDTYGVAMAGGTYGKAPCSGVGRDSKDLGHPGDCPVQITLLPDGRMLATGFQTKDDKAH